ncbi:MAG: class I SAM-dependent methyltransferase [Candidatus Zhuqueibacterota bacterium]
MLSKIDLNDIGNERTIRFLKQIQPDSGIYKNNYEYACYIALYLFAHRFCAGKNVLDAACGLGYGSYLLATTACHVEGIDIDESRIAYAREKYGSGSVRYAVSEVTDTPFENDSFDVVVSIETFEHLRPEQAVLFLSEVKRILKPDGIFILSTPNKPVFDQITRVEDHINEMDVDSLRELFARHFTSVQMYHQRKNVLNDMKAYYSVIKMDRFKLRQLFPRRLRKFVNRFVARDVTREIDSILPTVLVQKAESPDEVKQAPIQLVVCSLPK